MDPTTETTVDVLTRLDIDTVVPAFSRALASLDAATTRELDAAGIPAALRELVRVRASHLNGCACCLGVHTRDALDAGEQPSRLAALAAWRDAPFFTARERAALALTDAITRAAEARPTPGVTDAQWAEASTRLTAGELGALVALITTINAWNAVGVSTHAWTPTL